MVVPGEELFGILRPLYFAVNKRGGLWQHDLDPFVAGWVGFVLFLVDRGLFFGHSHSFLLMLRGLGAGGFGGTVFAVVLNSFPLFGQQIGVGGAVALEAG